MMIEMVVDDDGSDMLNTMVSLGNDLEMRGGFHSSTSMLVYSADSMLIMLICC